jgi:hypothetical protein
MNDYQKEIFEQLTRKFPPTVISLKDTDYMKGQKVIPHQYILDRLNEVLGFNWEFRVEKEEIHQNKTEGGVFIGGEVSVLGTLTLHIPSSESNPTPFYLERSRSQYGKKELELNADRTHPSQIADDMKAAASTALVKCASLFGIGLELYFPEEEAKDREQKATTLLLEEISYICKHILNINKKELTEFAQKALKINDLDVNDLENYQYAALYAHLLKAVKNSKTNS